MRAKIPLPHSGGEDGSTGRTGDRFRLSPWRGETAAARALEDWWARCRPGRCGAAGGGIWWGVKVGAISRQPGPLGAGLPRDSFGGFSGGSATKVGAVSGGVPEACARAAGEVGMAGGAGVVACRWVPRLGQVRDWLREAQGRLAAGMTWRWGAGADGRSGGGAGGGRRGGEGAEGLRALGRVARLTQTVYSGSGRGASWGVAGGWWGVLRREQPG